MEIVRKFKSIELFAFTYCSTITIGVTFLPYMNHLEVRSAWLKLFVGVVPYFILLLLIKQFTQKYESYDFFAELKNLIWKPIFYVIISYFIVSAFLVTHYNLEALALLSNTYLLPNSDLWLITLLFLLVVIVGLLYGIAAISRFLVALVFFEFLLIIAVVALMFTDYFKWINIPPVWTTDTITFLKSSITDMIRYGGIVALLGFLPFIKKGTSILKPMAIALFLIAVTFISISLVVLGTFGFDQALTLFSPITAVIQSIPTRTGVIERLDLFFLGFWIIAYYKLVVIQLWFLQFLMNKVYPEKKQGLYIITIVGLLFLVTTITPSFIEQQWLPLIYNQVVYTNLLPVALLLLLIFKKSKGADQSESA
ncbi:GerAB/ArcD/ProY family transporter [Bacillaceae bacterium IKA-2]|nr:GerAB/ArcD/ProY family transporter [Bacillaceae bacterium IKA-2]